MIDLSQIVVKPQPVEIAGLSEPLYVRSMVVADLDRMQSEERSRSENLIHMAELFMCDEGGNAVVTTDEQREMLTQFPLPILRTIVDAGLALNGMLTEDDAEEAEEAAKKE